MSFIVVSLSGFLIGNGNADTHAFAKYRPLPEQPKRLRNLRTPETYSAFFS
jgi:hypothetical protein